MGGNIPPNPFLPTLVTNQTKIPYPKPLKNSNKTILRLNESKNNSLDIFHIIKTHFSLLKTIYSICVKIQKNFIQPHPISFLCARHFFPTLPPPPKKTLQEGGEG